MTDDLKRFAEHWFAYDGWPDDALIARHNLRPVAKEIGKVLAHLDAERARIHAEDETKREQDQRAADSEPRHTYRLRRVAPFGFHRVPVDCWRPYGEVVYKSNDWRHRVVAGTIEVHAINTSGGPGMDLIGPMLTSVRSVYPMSCHCPVDATVVATERWATEFADREGWTLEPMTG